MAPTALPTPLPAAAVLDGITEQAVVAFDAQGRLTAHNAGAERLTGRSSADALGGTITALHDPLELVERAAALGVEPGVEVLTHLPRRLVFRPDDIPELVRHFADWFPDHENLPYRAFSVSAQNRLRNHPWPGNVRELRNVIQRLLVMGGDGDVSAAEVDRVLKQAPTGVAAPEGSHRVSFDQPLREAREQFEREYLLYQLERAGGSVGKLSEAVGMERTHLYRKLRALGIDPRSGARRGDNA